MINSVIQHFAASCSGGSFFGFPTWYKYLDGIQVIDPQSGQVTGCVPKMSGLNDIWLVVAAIIDILLRLVAIAAVIMIIYGGVQYVMSQGEPDKTKKALSTIINSLVGLVIAMGAAAFITFAAGKF